MSGRDDAVAASGAEIDGGTRGTLVQRVRAGAAGALGAVLARLPIGVVNGLADAAGELTYRLAGRRADVARGNLAHVVGTLAAEGRGGRRVRTAAADQQALERLVRAAFRHAARTYAETLRGAAATGRDIRDRFVLESPDALDRAVALGGPRIFTTLHFGSMMAEIAFLATRIPGPVTAPMETIADPELQRLLRRARESGGVRTVDLSLARRELRGALARGEGVAIVADRDIAGGGIEVPFFGLPARLPVGPALLAVESGAALYMGAVWRVPGGGYRGRLVELAHPPATLARRARVEALLADLARSFEDVIVEAPEQWWAAFQPIWPTVGPLGRRPAASRSAAAPPDHSRRETPE